MKFKCLLCQEWIEAESYIDTEHYDGQFSCEKCESLLQVKLSKGKVQQMKIVEKKFRTPAPDEFLKMMRQAEKDAREYEKKLGLTPRKTKGK